MLAAYLRGIQRFDLFNVAATGTAAVRAVLFIIALRSGAGILTIAFITLGMGLVSFALNYRMVRWADPALTLRFTRIDRKRLRELFGFSVYAFIASLGSRLVTRIDSIVIGRILSVAMIAPFNIASRLNDYFSGIFGGIHGPVLSAMSKLDGASEPDELRALFLRSTRYTFLLSLLIGSVLISDGKTLLTLWLGSSGLDVSLTYRLLVILTVCYTSGQALLPSWIVIYARAQHHLLAWITLGEGAANLILSVYWGYRYGLVGIAFGTAVPAIVNHLLIIPLYALRVVHLSVRRYVASLLRPLLIGVVFAALCAINVVQPRSIIVFGLQVLCQVSVFAFFAYSFAVTTDDKQFLWMRCKAVFHRGR
jgi:O-antigen/teichoic acid export membrane protein